MSGTWGYRVELSGQWDRLRWQIPASLTGAAIGAFLLLHLPEKVFTRVVPVLLVLALILVVIGPRIQAYARRRAEGRPVRRARLGRADGGVGVRHVRGGGVRRLLHRGAGHPADRRDGALLPEDIQRMNAAKNLLSLLVNVVAAAGYTLVAFDRISWPAAGLIAAGSLVGGWLGARYGRRLSPNALRAVIVVVGLIGLYRLLSV